MFYILARFRIGIVPLLCSLAAVFVQRIMTAWRFKEQPSSDKGRQRLILLGFVAACAAFVVCSAFPLYQDLYEADIIRALRPNGIAVQGKDSVLIYDHGPFCIGGSQWINPSDGGTLEIQKTFVIPPENRELFATHATTVRIPFFNQSRSPYTATFINGARQTVPQITNDRFIVWLEATFETLVLNDDGTATVILRLNGSPDTAVGIDRLRCYNRTRYISNNSPLEIPFEASLEIHAKK